MKTDDEATWRGWSAPPGWEPLPGRPTMLQRTLTTGDVIEREWEGVLLENLAWRVIQSVERARGFRAVFDGRSPQLRVSPVVNAMLNRFVNRQRSGADNKGWAPPSYEAVLETFAGVKVIPDPVIPLRGRDGTLVAELCWAV